MMDKVNEVLDDFNQESQHPRRRKLLPWWLKTFSWIFMISGAIAPLGIIAGIIKYPINLSLYGLETYNGLSAIGLLLISVFTIKGMAAFGLWTEKEWAIKVGSIDAIIGIITCIFMMLFSPFLGGKFEIVFQFRIEILFLIMYYNKLQKIKPQWLSS